MNNHYKKILAELLLADQIGPKNVNAIIENWVDTYEPLSIKGHLKQGAFDTIKKKEPHRFVSYIQGGNEFDGNSFIKTTPYFIALIKNSDPSYVSYGIYYVS